MGENVNFVPKEINPPNAPLRHVRLRIFGAVWHKKFKREAFLWVMAKVRSIDDNGFYALFKKKILI